MSTAAVSNPVPQGESRSARKKKASRAENNAVGTTSNASASAMSEPPVGDSAGAESSSDSPYIRELQKNVRNIKKKLSAMQKLDSVIAANPGKSLDELLSSRHINADQKIQAEKKPFLQATLTQLEEQLEHFRKFDDETKEKHEAERALLVSAHSEELAKVKETAEAEAKTEASKALKENLLALSRFLRSAAAKRQDGDETTEENRAFEGALLLVYGGDLKAVMAMESLIEGSEDQVPTVEGELSSFTYKQVRDASGGSEFAAEEAWVDSVAQSEPGPVVEESTAPVQSDPTQANISLTELDAAPEPPTNGADNATETPTVPKASNIGASAANAAADSKWQANMSSSVTSNPDSWVDVNKEVPRDPAETDTGLAATPAAAHATQSWAEDVPTEPTPVPAATKDDGFHEVHHSRGRGRGSGQGEPRGGRGRGGYRGDRGGDGYRGRGGYRGGGDRGGRGRGGPRGGGQRGRGDSS